VDENRARFGRTGLRITRLGLGLAALGRPGYITLDHGRDLAGHTEASELERRTHDVLETAFAGGIRYFDVARSYGGAESFLASWLERRRIGRSEVTVGSKWGYTYTADWRVEADRHEVKDLSAGTLRRQLAESRATLGGHLRLYQIHSATLESGVLDDPGVLEELARLRESDVAVGVSATGPRQRETIERAVETGAFDAVQATWNLLERSVEPALEAAHAAGLGVIVKEAVANGRLTRRGGITELLDLAGERDVEPDALALAAASAQPWVDVVLSGAATVEQLESNLGARAIDYDEELERALASLVEPPDAYWATRAALAWN
jgi:aryl-alcohol dehydrogenase-like predicted oxidoreductase